MAEPRSAISSSAPVGRAMRSPNLVSKVLMYTRRLREFAAHHTAIFMGGIRAIIFDLDNTLWDVWPVILRAEHAMHDFLRAPLPACD